MDKQLSQMGVDFGAGVAIFDEEPVNIIIEKPKLSVRPRTAKRKVKMSTEHNQFFDHFSTNMKSRQPADKVVGRESILFKTGKVLADSVSNINID